MRGAVVVKNNKVIGEGYHKGAGQPHAEVMVLENLKEEANGADIYVTLEPCCHHGRTPPCTDLIIKHKLKHVYFGLYDPNPEVSGKGQELLHDAGIECEHVALTEIEDFYKPYIYWWKHQRPFATVKLALTADCKTALPGKQLSITGETCQRYTHQQRLESDALLTTAQTIIADDPQYNARLIDDTLKKPIYILDSRARLPIDARIFKTCESVTVFHSDQAHPENLKKLQKAGVQCVLAPNTDSHKLDLHACLDIIAKNHHTLWVEAGWRCTQSFIEAGLAQNLLFYFSPKTAGEGALPESPIFSYEKGQNREMAWKSLGSDMLLELF